jgi:hypothetical protein
MEIEDQVHLTGSSQSQLSHSLLEEVSGLQQAWQVVKDVLGVTVGSDARNRQAGGLGLRTHNGEVLSYQGVEQGGFAHVGGSGERDVTGLGRHGGKV